MRPISLTLSNFPTATAWLAGAALLAGTSGSASGSQPAPVEDTAIAIPRIGGFGGAEVSMPQPLAPSEAARISRIFALQAHGALEAAARQTEELDTSTPLGQAMLGTILADRYLGRFTHPGVAELRSWLARWPDLPDAAAIHALLLARLPNGAPRPPAPFEHALASPRGSVALPPAPEETGFAERSLSRNPDLDRSVAEAARNRGAAGVARLLARTKGLTTGYASQLSGEAARVLFTLNRDSEAYDLGVSGARACGRWPRTGCQTAALAGFSGGLAAWRMGRTDLARPLFEAAWRAPLTTPALRAAAAFWAARAQSAPGPRDAGPRGARALWLGRAAAEPFTFYGMIARRSLGLSASRVAALAGERFGNEASDADPETLGEADLDAVASTPQGMRAFAMMQVGELDRAETELRLLCPDVAGAPLLAQAVMLVADRAGLSTLAAQLADLLQATDGRPREQTRFRVPRLRPDGGFKVDPAMVYALARTESNFDATLVSSAGARGIMQIMPDTADFIVAGLRDPRPGHAASGARLRGLLEDPGANLALGQTYVSYLSSHEVVDGDLIRLLASYNTGPANFARWAPSINDRGDPLLFIESIPTDETRAFVPRVLTYTWIYAARLHLPRPSLDELAGGEWPQFHPLPQRALRPPRLH